MDETIETAIENRASSAPRVTPADIEGVIATEHYFTAEQGHRQAMTDAVYGNGGIIESQHANPAPQPLALVTICVLILRNGTKVVGVNEGPVSRENFDAEIGRKVARANAVNKIWPLLGYQLKSELAYDEQTSLVSTQGGRRRC